jgi:hypothetical protein
MKQENTPERRKMRAAYYQKNKEKISENWHQYYLEHKEAIAERCHKRYLSHQEEEIKKNRINYKEYGHDNRLKRKERMKGFLLEQKAVGCAICGEKDPLVLEFHHIDPSQKVKAIAGMLGMPLHKVKAELEKCVVLCANDHIRVQRGAIELPKGKR